MRLILLNTFRIFSEYFAYYIFICPKATVYNYILDCVIYLQILSIYFVVSYTFVRHIVNSGILCCSHVIIVHVTVQIHF